MSNEFANYIPIQDLPPRAAPAVDSLNRISASFRIDATSDVNPNPTMSESVVIVVT